MNFCTKCGNQLKPGARFCGSCGESVSQSLQSTASIPVTELGSRKPDIPRQQDFRIPNSQRRIVNLWIILLAVFVFCVFLPTLIGMDGFDGGFFISFLSGFAAIMSIVVILIYRSRARQLGKILSGEGRIAVWRYSPDEWMRFVSRDFEEDKKMKRMLFFVISGISLVIGVIMIINFQDPVFIPIILGIIVIVAIPAFLAPHFRYRKLQNSEAAVLIAENGLIVGKMFHLWVKLGARLDQVTINSEEEPVIIEFTYSMPTRNGRDVQMARIPVPHGKMEEAIRITEYFSLKILQG